MKAYEESIAGIFRSLPHKSGWSPPGVSLLAARRMWASTRGEDTVVAVLDTGIDYYHPDLKGNVIGGNSFIATERDFMDKNGHGTHVAGIIAANNQILGVAPNAKLLAVKVLDKGGNGSYRGITAGLRYAREWRGPQGQKVNVINMSLGGPEPEKEMYQEILKGINAGITVVCAAGNEGDGRQETDEISYPAYYKETIAVGAVNLQTRVANFSNTNSHIDVVAPGVDTYSTYPGGRYVKLSGTSMAAPHISGAVALIYSRYKKKFGTYPTSGTVSLLVDYFCVDLGDTGWDDFYGYGLLAFNLDGAKSITVQAGSSSYDINGQSYPWQAVPDMDNNIMKGSCSELAELLGCDSELNLADGTSSNPRTKLQIWR